MTMIASSTLTQSLRYVPPHAYTRRQISTRKMDRKMRSTIQKMRAQETMKRW